MRSSIRVLYIALFLVLGPAQAGHYVHAAAQEADPDALYRERATPGRADAAADLSQKQLTGNPKDFDAAWKLSRVLYWTGTQGPEAGRRAALERGLAAGRQAAALMPDRPDGHFWMAANMGALAESFGMRQGLRYRGDIKRELEIVLMLDPTYQSGSADRALGRWYHKVPGLFGGSRERAEQHLRKSLTYNPNSTVSHLFLAELLFDMDRDAEAKQELQRVIEAPLDPNWAPEDRVFKEQARQRLQKN
jgi:tetratricopeptide (TPR) repeat protein